MKKLHCYTTVTFLLLWSAFGADNTFIYNDSDVSLTWYSRYVNLANPCAGEGVGGANTMAPHTMLSFESTGNYQWFGWVQTAPSCAGGGTGNLVTGRPYDGCGYALRLGFGPWTSAGYTFHFSCNPVTNYCASLDCVNTDSVSHNYKIYSNAVGVVGVQIGTKFLYSGDQMHLQICGPTNGVPFNLYAIETTIGGNADIVRNTCIGTMSTNVALPQPPQKFQNTNSPSWNATNPVPTYDGNTTNINWGGPTNLATEGTLKTGLSALWDAIWKGNNTLDADLRALTNMGVWGGDKYATNTPGAINYGHGTNATIADGQAALGQADTDAATAETGMGTAPTVDGGSASIFTFSFCGQTINLDPENTMPGLGGVVRNLIGWGATIWFMFWLLDWYKKLVTVTATAQTGGVPDLEVDVAGFGGNVAGWVAAVTVSIVFIGLWVGIFTYLFSKVFNLQSSAYFTTNPWSGMSGFYYSAKSAGAAALYLLNLYIPMSYIMSLVWSRFTLGIALPKLVLAAAAASRMLWGR